jgi:PKD repeat protein
VKVRVTDNAGAVVESQVALTVQTQTPLASFTLSPSVPVAGEATTLDASGSVDPDGRIAAYEWDLDGVPGFERTTTAPEIQHTFATSDPVTVRLRVTDDSGDATLGTATSTPLTITPNRRPVAALFAAPATVIAGESVALNAAGSTDPDGTLARYEWDLDGDGTYELDTSTTTAASRTYATAGRVTARVRVTDNRGTTSTASVEVVIEGAPSAPSRVDPPADLPASPVPAPAASTAAPAPAPSAPLAVAAAVISPATPASAPSLAPPAIVPLAAPGPANTRIMGTPMQALRDALRRGITLRCISDRDATCSVTATLSAKDAARLKLAPRGGRKPVVIGAGLGRSGAHAGSVVVRLTARAARRMRGVKQVMVTLTGRATVDGRAVTLQRTVLLRA